MRNLLFVVVLIGLVLLVIIYPFWKSSVMATNYDTNSPIAPLAYESITISDNTREQFVEQMRQFADKHAFAIRFGSADPTGGDLLIQMWRDDFKIIADNPLDANKFDIGIYPTCWDKIPVDHARDLMSEILRSVASGIVVD